MSTASQLLIGKEDLAVQNDRILPITRVVGIIIIPILFIAFLILYGVPTRTADLFAWTIAPEMTPLIMGAGYGTGVYFFYRVATVREWHRVAPVFPGIAVFTWFMAAATFLHWENFNHSHVTFYFWTFLYLVSPLLIPGLWLVNRRTDPREGVPDSPDMPKLLRWGAAVSGLLITMTAVLIFFVPEAMVDNWPWRVSPLTTRILLGWFALFGVANLVVSFDQRWSAARILAHSQLIGFSLVLLGAFRAWENFDTTNPYTWPLIAGMAGYLLLVLAIYLVMER